MLDKFKDYWQRFRPRLAKPSTPYKPTRNYFDEAPIARSCLIHGDNGEIYYKVVKVLVGGLVVSRTRRL